MIELACVGALLMDMLGFTPRLPKHDEEVHVDGFTLSPGGSAANTAVAAAKLGIRAGFVGGVGEDQFGHMLVKDLLEQGVDTSGVKFLNKPTGSYVAVTDSAGDRHMYAATSAALQFSPKDIDPSYLAGAKIVHLADMPSTELLEAAAHHAGGLISINPGNLTIALGYNKVKPLLSNADIYISTRAEAERLYQTNDLNSIVSALLGEGISKIALTSGSEGALITDGNRTVRVPAFKVNIVDATGAGDAFSAGFLYGIIKGLPLEECGRWGNAAAAMCISKLGARLNSTKPEIERLVRGSI